MKPRTEEFKKHRAEYIKRKRSEGKYKYKYVKKTQTKETIDFSEVMNAEYLLDLSEKVGVKLQNRYIKKEVTEKEKEKIYRKDINEYDWFKDVVKKYEVEPENIEKILNKTR